MAEEQPREERRWPAAVAAVAVTSFVAVALAWSARGGTPDAVLVDGTLTSSPSPTGTPVWPPAGGHTPLPLWRPAWTVSPSTEQSLPPSPDSAGRYVGHWPRTGSGGPRFERDDSHNPRFCDTAAEQPVSEQKEHRGFCSNLVAPATVTAGQPARLAYTLCLRPDAAAQRLTYVDDVPVYFRADDGAYERWRVIGGYSVASDYVEIAFDPGDCVTWTVVWLGQDHSGRTLSPGRYQLTAEPRSVEALTADRPYPGPKARVTVQVVEE